MIRRKVTVVRYMTFWNGEKLPGWEDVYEFLVPLALLFVGQWIPLVVRRDKLLPVGHRVRGDVLI